jgi:hypothetical protein
MKSILFQFLVLTLVFAEGAQGAGFFERLGLRKSSTATNSSASSVLATALSQDEITGGLKQALSKGVSNAVAMLGKQDGFLKDTSVKIPMPDSLQRVEQALRTVRQDALADEFVTTMNRAAEQAVPEAAAVLGDSVKQMTVADAKTILTSTNNAATAYFRRTSETNLYGRFLPIVQKATEQAGVTSAYKKMTAKASFGGFSAGSLLGQDAIDLDGFVTRKALDGLFLKIGEEEKRIRENPVARTTDLLQKVFGAVRPPATSAGAPAK